LPASLADFFSSLQSLMITQIDTAQRALLSHNQQRLFPNSASSAQLLHENFTAAFPRTAHENRDGIWATASEQTQTSQLEHNGYVEIAGGVVRLRLPDDVSLGQLYGDSKLYMDLLLKGYSVRRQVGSESVKVTSLGKAQWSSSYTDDFGRSWQMFSWAEPWNDVLLVAMSLPTPEGYVSFLYPVPSGYRQLAVNSQKLLANFVYVALGGTFSQWRDYLSQKNVAPKILSTTKLEIDPEHALRFRSNRCELNVTPELLPLSRDSMLWLSFNFFRDGSKVVWDVGGVSVEESAQKHNWVEFWRNSQPDAGLPQGFQSHWSKLQAREFPFNGTVSNSNGATRISTTADPSTGTGEAAKVRYVLTLIAEGDQPQEAMGAKLELLRHSFKVLEH
jgi:serine protease Do